MPRHEYLLNTLTQLRMSAWYAYVLFFVLTPVQDAYSNMYCDIR